MTAIRDDGVLQRGGIIIVEGADSSGDALMAGDAAAAPVSLIQGLMLWLTHRNTDTRKMRHFPHADRAAIALGNIPAEAGCYHGSVCFVVKSTSMALNYTKDELRAFLNFEVDQFLPSGPAAMRRPGFTDVCKRTKSDKCTEHNYGSMYERVMWPLRGVDLSNKAAGAAGTGLNFLEIGVGCDMDYIRRKKKRGAHGAAKVKADTTSVLGASVNLWPKYLSGFARQIQFMEYDEDCVQQVGGRSHQHGYDMTIHAGDQCKWADLKRVTASSGPLDVVIDDGGHHWAQQLSTLDYFLNHDEALVPGGLLVIEDMETSSFFTPGGFVGRRRDKYPDPDIEARWREHHEGKRCGVEDAIVVNDDLPFTTAAVVASLARAKALSASGLTSDKIRSAAASGDGDYAAGGGYGGRYVSRLYDKAFAVACSFSESCYVIKMPDDQGRLIVQQAPPAR